MKNWLVLSLALSFACNGTDTTTDGATPEADAARDRDAAVIDARVLDARVVDAHVVDASEVDAGETGEDAGSASYDVDCNAFEVTGDATAMRGADWTYESVDGGVEYRLRGVLFAPEGEGPFPSVVVSHGFSGSAEDYGSRAASTLRGFGMVAIATNYTHGSVTGLLPDDPGDDFGASPANILRAHKALELLTCVAVADTTRVAAHGHSMGAFVTVAFVATYPSAIMAASHTAGGVADPPAGETVPAPRSSLAAMITTPYQLHHGTNDCTVRLMLGEALDEVLTEAGTVHELHTYEYPGECVCPSPPGECDDHRLVSDDDTMWSRVHAWYTTHGVL